MKILVTGFSPFGGEKVNPAFEAVKLLPNQIKNAEIIKLEIPVVFENGAKEVEKAIELHKPDAVLNIGQAGGRSSISIEKVAINLRDAVIPDNDGNKPIDSQIRANGKNAYFSTLPVKAMVENVRNHGIPSHLSYTAGTYVCNDVMYLVLHLLEEKYPNIKAGFIHVPYDISQVIDKASGLASMPVEIISKGLEYAIEAVIDNDEDISSSMGTTH